MIREVLETSSPVSAEIEGRITIIKAGSEDKAVANPIVGWVSSQVGS